MQLPYGRNILFCLFFSCLYANAQDVTFAFSNAQNTSSGGVNYYEADVTISSGTGFKLGQSTLYINYNTAAFGLNVVTNGALTVTNPTGYVLGQTASGFPIYSTVTPNDNTSSRLAISWLQGLCSGLIPGNNVTSTPTLLLHIKLKYSSGGSGQGSSICWQTGNPYEDQTRNACGPSASCFFADCMGANNGTTLTDDHFDCAGIPDCLVNIWTGAGGSFNWTDPANWSKGVVPLQCQDIVIPTGNTVIVPINYNAFGKTLDVQGTAQLTVGGNCTLNIQN